MPKYSASAECLEESMVMIFAKEFVQDITDADPVNGMRFYRRLARMLGNRWIHTYHQETGGAAEGVPNALETEEQTKPHHTA